jgi:succinate dehydrogenase / fumarate reductase cytochrome b subunit
MAAPKRTLWASTIGLKIIMAVSGLGLLGFVLFHMLGHLQVLSGGRDAYNAYAHFMYGLGGFLWVARAGLLGVLAVHVVSAVALEQRNDAARPTAYVVQTHRASTPMSRAMLVSGVGVLAFVAYHLAHFTLGLAHPEHFSTLDTAGRRDVYGNFVYSFQDPLVFGLYTVAMVLLCMHLGHACTSMFRTLGLMHGRFRQPLSKVGPLVAVVTGVGFLLPPLACLLRLVTP